MLFRCQQGVRHFSSTGPQPFSHAQPTGIPQKQETARSYRPPHHCFVYKGSGQRGRDLADDTCVLLNIPPWKGLRASGLDLVKNREMGAGEGGQDFWVLFAALPVFAQ